jgi:hypothetical protein
MPIDQETPAEEVIGKAPIDCPRLNSPNEGDGSGVDKKRRPSITQHLRLELVGSSHVQSAVALSRLVVADGFVLRHGARSRRNP